MTNISKSYREELNVHSSVSAEEVRVFDDIVRKRRALPEGVRKVEFRFGEDSSGAAAVWIVFTARDDLKPSPERIAAIREFAEEVRAEVRRTGSERWPYVTIEVE